MTGKPLIPAMCVADEHVFDLEAFAAACGAEPAFIIRLVEEELLEPVSLRPVWRFGGEALARARRIRRLQQAFDANLASVAVMLDLIDEIERLRAALHRAGLDAP